MQVTGAGDERAAYCSVHGENNRPRGSDNTSRWPQSSAGRRIQMATFSKWLEFRSSARHANIRLTATKFTDLLTIQRFVYTARATLRQVSERQDYDLV